MNKSLLIGRLTKDPALRYTQSGAAVVKGVLAVNRPFAKEGEQQADFIPVTAWAKTAEIMAQYLTKGSQVGITGRIQTGRYEDQEGRTVYTTEVIVEQLDFLDSKKKEAGPGAIQEAREVFPDSEVKNMDNQEIPF